MSIDMETRGEEVASGWRDHDGFIGPMPPGHGPRSDPRGAFPTGPDVGTSMPDIQCRDSFGNPFDLHEARAGRPAVFVFFRSAVW